MRFIPCLLAALMVVLSSGTVRADGKVMRPRDYSGSLEERGQEAIIVFHCPAGGEATEDLILKIDVKGKTDRFAWVLPFPTVPEVNKADTRLFAELFAYVEQRRVRARHHGGGKDKAKPAAEGGKVEVISRKVVGTYDVAIVRENEAGALNDWLRKEGFQTLPGDGEDVLEFYRAKKYVFACIKVADTGLAEKGRGELHPLRFTFRTGGRDGIYFPMKLTGLQDDPFDVNLYVFHRFWLNDHVSKFGYEHRGFHLNYRDWDSSECEPNAGKRWDNPADDSFLRPFASRLPTVAGLMAKLHPGERFYLTNISANNLKPGQVRGWPEDLWLFPYYTDPDRIPYDAQEGGIVADVWPDVPRQPDPRLKWVWYTGIVLGGVVIMLLAGFLVTRRKNRAVSGAP